MPNNGLHRYYAHKIIISPGFELVHGVDIGQALRRRSHDFSHVHSIGAWREKGWVYPCISMHVKNSVQGGGIFAPPFLPTGRDTDTNHQISEAVVCTTRIEVLQTVQVSSLRIQVHTTLLSIYDMYDTNISVSYR